MFSCEYCKNFKNSFFYRTTLVDASEYISPCKVEVRNSNSEINMKKKGI